MQPELSPNKNSPYFQNEVADLFFAFQTTLLLKEVV